MTLTSLMSRVMIAIGTAFDRAAMILKAVKNRREVMLLLDAPEGVLRDLGVSSGDVRASLTEPLWRDPSARLAIWSAERRAARKAQAQFEI